MELWLKNTIPGIIILGAFGSLLAIVPISLSRKLPILHRRRTGRQAFFHGYSSRCIIEDETGRMLLASLFYHFTLLTIFLTSFLFCAVLLSVVFAFQSNINVTVGSFILSSSAFVAIYLSYFEFEYIYRTYLFFWKKTIADAAEKYKKHYANP